MRLSIVTTALVFLAIPTIARAHGGNNNPDMVHACVGNASKIVRIVGVSGSCLSGPPVLGETPAHWPRVEGAGLQGPMGDKGDQGIPGPQGSPGANGTPGIDGTNGTNGADGISVTLVGYVLAGDVNCPNGGAVLAIGSVNAYVCNGQDATAGATGPDGPCFDNANRYVDCGNGTVTDTVTGLIWLQQANCLANADYSAANQVAAGLKEGDCNLTDGSSPGDWRLPTPDEWSATTARAVGLGCVFPSWTNDAGTACLSVGASSFAGVAPGGSNFWSSASLPTGPAGAYVTSFGSGSSGNSFPKLSFLRVWPVRRGTP